MEQILINSLINGSFYALSAMSFNLLLGTVKFFDVSYGARAVVAAYVVFLLYKTFHLPILFSIIGGVLAAVLLGLILEKFIYSPLREKKASNLVLLIASFGAFISLNALLGIFFGSQFQAISAGKLSGVFTSSLGSVTYLQVIFIIAVPIIFTSLMFFLKKSSVGRAIRAVGDNEELARISGINTKKVILMVCVLTSILAATVATFDLFDIGIDLTLGLKIILKTIIACIIGGVGSVPGGFLGGYILGGVENIAAWELGGQWQDAVSFLLLIIFLIFRPRGILGKK